MIKNSIAPGLFVLLALVLSALPSIAQQNNTQTTVCRNGTCTTSGTATPRTPRVSNVFKAPIRLTAPAATRRR